MPNQQTNYQQYEREMLAVDEALARWAELPAMLVTTWRKSEPEKWRRLRNECVACQRAVVAGPTDPVERALVEGAARDVRAAARVHLPRDVERVSPALLEAPAGILETVLDPVQAWAAVRRFFAGTFAWAGRLTWREWAGILVVLALGCGVAVVWLGGGR